MKNPIKISKLLTQPSGQSLFNFIKSAIIIIALLFFQTAIAQTEKGTSAILLHNFSPTGIKIDGLPVTLFPQTSGLGLSFGSHRTKMNGRMTDVKEKVMTFGISLSGHYFILDDFSIGLTGFYFSGVTTYSEAEKRSEKYATTMMMGGLELRYYLKGSDRIKYYMKVAPTLGSITSTYDDKEVHIPKRLYEFNGGIGLS